MFIYFYRLQFIVTRSGTNGNTIEVDLPGSSRNSDPLLHI